MRKVITLVLYNRPAYTRIVLDRLSRCDGVGDYILIVRAEPGNDEVIDLARSIDFAEMQLTVNSELLGGGRNTYCAWEAGFRLADFIVHLEDDTVPAPDCLRFMEHCASAYRDDQRIFSVASYNRYPCPAGQHDAISTRRQYTCWLVGIWKNRWLWAKDEWSPDSQRYATHLGKCIAAKKLREVYPLLSRSQNIGVKNGIHEHAEHWHRVYHHTEYWAGDDLPVQANAYYEVHNPMVTAVMVTGMHRDRNRTAKIAIECFRNQTYIHKQLLIINHGETPLSRNDDARIDEVMVQKRAVDTIGDLRNLGLRHAKGDLIMVWDDDDWHGPDRMAVQVAAQRGSAAVLLKRQIRYNLLNRSGICAEADEGLANTILHPYQPEMHYESVIRGEEISFLRYFREITVIDNDPRLHVQTYDGLNLCDEKETFGHYADDQCAGQLDLDNALVPEVHAIGDRYVQPWASGKLLRCVIGTHASI